MRVGRSEDVARRQLPILLPLAALSMIGGVVLLLGAVYPAISPLLAGVAGGGAAHAVGDGLASTFSWVEPSTVQMIFFGAALLVGGAWGLWKAVRDT